METPSLVHTLALLVIGPTLTACSSDSPSTAAPTSSSDPSRMFRSTRHGYSVEVPPGWDVTEYEGEWKSLEQFAPGAEVPGEDVVAPPDPSSFLVSNSMRIPPKMAASEWLAAFDALVAAGFDSKCPGSTGTGVVAGEPATVVEQPCDGSVVVGGSFTHEGRGYYFTIRFPAGEATTEVTLDGLVASIRFAED